MAITRVQTSGALLGGGPYNWTPSSTPSVNNLLTYRMSTYQLASSTGVTDSSGTPKVFQRDAYLQPDGSSGIYSYIIPSGLTTPLKDNNTNGNLHGVFDEWTGNETTSYVDGANQVQDGSSPITTPTIAASAAAGLALAACQNVFGGALTPVDTTNWVNDVNVNATVQAAFDYRITNVASQSISQGWTTGSAYAGATAVIAVYKAAAASGTSLNAGGQTVTLSNPTATLTPGSASLSAGDQTVNLSNPTATPTPGALSLNGGQQAVNFSAPDATVDTSSPQNVSAGQQLITVTAPDAQVEGILNLAAGQQQVLFTAPSASFGLGNAPIAAGEQTVSIQAPIATISGGAAPTEIPLGDDWIRRT